MSDKVGGYTGTKPGGVRMDSDKVGLSPRAAIIKSIKPGG